jgi:hypothetical protein
LFFPFDDTAGTLLAQRQPMIWLDLKKPELVVSRAILATRHWRRGGLAPDFGQPPGSGWHTGSESNEPKWRLHGVAEERSMIR